jgi:hypothetical protein
MKLSNKILLGFFGFIFIYLTAAFVEVRMTGTLNVIDDKNSVAETADIHGIAYLIINDLDISVNVIGSDRAQLEVRSLSGDVLKKLKYQLSGDTLRLWGVGSEIDGPVRISVFVPGSLKEITVNTSHVIVRNLQQQQLRIAQNSGRLTMSDSRISKMEMDLSNQSYLGVFTTNVDTLSASIVRSQVKFDSSVGLLRGSMKENSILQLNGLREILLTKDETSVVNLY